ncbi:helix-hairpin-helix domain-containing protein [Nocardia cyriacigeorgica]|uniref:Uncharacterized protein conserved in bacteria n=1 Tax=Nocardia cyriacigeorgica TaxID=135487 RepID=A0A4V6ICH6_9NOCA|nr:helix-hairpin-helix domain-containing protein [Nocardia cyriacigeorgica]MBF6161481.1 hypothetical protein [Nocardia cyriacigeorgica]MBF6200094.1 hypothetical protein [Nocardia cyriacigeorgica]MBF6318614.1 hypothetical protein [Nocardia cyriacigeorgica]MBF6346582.1 hypothetical protein [Nocardia cyriacigeorgica]MBF6513204.1 hypothetical protein [Nocardia cyriacigeorgica]
MTTRAQVRKAALALPEVDEGTHFGSVAYRVRGKSFASISREDELQVQLADDEIDGVLADHPSGAVIERAGKRIGLRIALADINGQTSNHLVRRAWFARAPKRLAACLAAADNAAPGDGDLPASIGKAATRALHGAGITTLDALSTRTRAELLSLHGFGPKAARVLAEALEERGLTFAGE